MFYKLLKKIVLKINVTKKPLVFLTVLAMLFALVLPVSAQGKTPPTPDQLTTEQMKNAVIVDRGLDSNFLKTLNGQVYRFSDCDASTPKAPCYFIVTGSDTSGIKSTLTTPLANTATITCTCGRNIYNGTGKNVARLQQNVNVTFENTYGKTPVTMNWGNLNGTTGTLGYGWQDLTGPNPNPGWGVSVPYRGTAYSTAGGIFVYLGVMQSYISVRITINKNGWTCQ